MGTLDSPDFWRNEADWMLDLEQTHTAFPILSYFPETHPDHSWVATVGTLLDAAALVVVGLGDATSGEVFADVEKGPLMVLVYGLPLIVRIARAANVPLPPPTRLPDLIGALRRARPADQRRPGRVRRRHGGPGAGSSSSSRADEEEAWRRFAWIRSAYEPALRALAGLPPASPAPWTTDRPAVVGKPRFLRRRPLHVDWSGRLPLRGRRPRAALQVAEAA